MNHRWILVGVLLAIWGGWNGGNAQDDGTTQDINPCDSDPCMNNGTCQNVTSTTYNCTCLDGYEGTKCETDVDECSLDTDTCHERAVCTDTDGGYNCTCDEGYIGDGRQCNFDDHCMSSPCGDRGFCSAKTLGYECHCYQGWSGLNCTVEDNPCSPPCHAQWGMCMRTTTGQHQCLCTNGTRGNGTECYEIPVWDMFDAPYDTEPFTSHIELPVPGGFPFFGSIYSTIYVTGYGYLTFDVPYNQPNPPMADARFPNDIPILAAYWGYGGGEEVDMSQSALKIQTFNHTTIQSQTELVDKIRTYTDPLEDTSSSVTYVAILTWYQLPRWPASVYAGIKNVTFQVVLMTNGTASLALLNYGAGFGTNVDTSENFTAGFYDEYGLGSPVNIENTQRPDMSSFNSNTLGEYVLLLGEPVMNRDLACILWYNTAQPVTPTHTCPCSGSQAMADMFFSQSSSLCYTTITSFEPQTCCYTESGALDTDMTYGTDDEYKACCVDTNLCHLYHDVYPSDDCSMYKPPSIGGACGDPHFVTFDSATLDYTFNGLGEFILVEEASFQLQARFELIESQENATKITALAVKTTSSGVVDIRAAGDDAEVFIDGEAYNASISTPGVQIMEDVDVDAGLVFTDEKILMPVSIVDGYISVMVIFRNSGTTRNTRGLLGNMNGNADDDFTLSDGTVITRSESEEDIFQFGMENRVMSNATSLFNYALDGEDMTFSTFHQPDFTPTFFRDLIRTNLSSIENVNETEARELCGEEEACLVDFVATGNDRLAVMTKNFLLSIENTASILRNFPPLFHDAPSVVDVTASAQDVIITFNVTSDGDHTVAVMTSLPEQSYNLTDDDVTYTFTWNAAYAFLQNDTNKDSFLLKFSAQTTRTDPRIYWPTIHLCLCHLESQCDWTDPMYSQDEHLVVGACQCPPNKAPPYCQSDVDPCQPHPCYPGVQCQASDDTDTAFVCGECPETLQGNGVLCYDIDECVTGDAQCSQTCTNTQGSFECSCMDGYMLAADSMTCDDVDECQQARACLSDQICENTPGSFKCKCSARYIMSDTGTCVAAPVRFEGQLSFQAVNISGSLSPWDPMLLDPNTDLFMKAAQVVENTVDGVFMNAPGFIVSRVNSFSQGSIKGLYTLYFTDATGLNSTMANEQLLDALACVDDRPDCIVDGLLGVNKAESFVQDKDLCLSSTDNDCDPSSTDCTSQGGTFTCTCKDGYQTHNLITDICSDIDECMASDACVNATSVCVNLPGSYMCECKPGNYPIDQLTCADVCDPSPCENDGTCSRGERSHMCECKGLWTGVNCTEKHDDAKRYRDIAIGVGVGVGVLCLLLLIITLVACCRSTSEKPYEQTRTYDERGYNTASDITLDKWESRQHQPTSRYQDPAATTTTFSGSTKRTQGMENPAYHVNDA